MTTSEAVVNGFIRRFKQKFRLLRYNISNDICALIISYYHIPPIIIHNGSGWMKIGYTNDNTPHISFPSIVARPRHSGVYPGMTQPDAWIGDDATTHRGICHCAHPIEHGYICNFDDMHKIWKYSFDKLKIQPDDCDILLTEPALNPKTNREKMTEIMFESFNINRLYIAIDAVLSLYACGNLTGIAVESGYAVTHTVPIYEGYCLPHLVDRMDIGGIDHTEYLQKLLNQKGWSFTTTAEKEILVDIKEKLCYVAMEYEDEFNNVMNVEYELPDGQKINIGDASFRTGEILFQPCFVRSSTNSIHGTIVDVGMRCDKDIRNDLFNNIVLNGGNTLFKGFEDRLKKEVQKRVPEMKVNVIATEYRKCSSFIGGAILTSLSSFEKMWITRDEYWEVGPSIVHVKCG